MYRYHWLIRLRLFLGKTVHIASDDEATKRLAAMHYFLTRGPVEEHTRRMLIDECEDAVPELRALQG